MPTKTDQKIEEMTQLLVSKALRTASEKVRAKAHSSKAWSSGSYYDDDNDRARHEAVNEAIETALREVADGLEAAADDLSPEHHENCDTRDLMIKGKPCNCKNRS